jgi:hypothetical protein
MSTSKTVRALGLLLLLLSFCVGSHAQRRREMRGRWEYLGEANVDGQRDHDNIVVTAAKGEYRAIQIRVEKAPIEFDRVIVHYRDGVSEPIHIRKVIPNGGQTRAIDLPGDRRIIESVEFWYSRASISSRKPKIRLFGLH